MSLYGRLKSRWSAIYSAVSDTVSEDYLGQRAPKGFRIGIMVLLIAFLFLIALGWYWSAEPKLFDVRPSVDSLPTEVPGAVTTATLINVIDVLLNKPGGYLSNDVIPPGVWLDNLPSWEFGVIVQARDLSKAMRESFSRSQSQSAEDPDLALAEPRFNIDHLSWAVPWPESEYASARDYLSGYLKRLVKDEAFDAQFFTRADNLSYWLGTVEKRLGSLSQRLSASVGQRRLNTDLAGDPEARQSTPTPSERFIKTRWLRIDNVYYEARGTSWALIHFLRAVEVDFSEVLIKKGALVSVQQIIRELEMTQQAVHAPIILNGEGFGVLANHSLVMASYISRANAAIIDLRDLLARG